MKIIAIGDIHGRNNWKKIVEENEFDMCVFVGDYFDSFNIPVVDQIHNFKEIVEFKKANRAKVKLLIGNHDFHYLRWTNESYSGFQPFQKTTIGEILHQEIHKDRMQMCYEQDGYLFTHAGVTSTWLRNWGYKEETTIEEHINELFTNKPRAFEFQMGENFSGTGDDTCQGPIWVRPRSLVVDAVPGFKHVVGHTSVKDVAVFENVVLIDCLEYSGNFLTIVDGEILPHPTNSPR